MTKLEVDQLAVHLYLAMAGGADRRTATTWTLEKTSVRAFYRKLARAAGAYYGHQ